MGITRRTFLSVSVVSFFEIACSMYGIKPKGELGDILRDFNPYNGMNPHVRTKQKETFLDNIWQHKPAWAGSQYRSGISTPVVATARGKIYKVTTHDGYHGKEDDVTIDHGGGFCTRYFHMDPNSSEVLRGRTAERGTVIGMAGMLPFKTSMKFWGILGDLDDYGEHMGYMDYWDGRELDKDPDQIEKFSNKHTSLIKEFLHRYIGPGAKVMQRTNFYGIPIEMNHGNKDYCWSYAMVFKTLKYLYEKNSAYFSGNDNNDLMAEVYRTQPVINTLPLKK